LKRYLLDSGIASDHINQRRGVHSRVRATIAAGDPVGVCMPVVGELFAGIEFSHTREKNLQRLRRFLATATIWPFDRRAAEEYGRIYATLRRSGRLIPQIDLQIAAIALTLGRCTVVTKDHDFSAVSGLRVENWAEGKQ
jgi:tRNA(fMet)-specific endonuclease VapC